jgi:hypothetical protein
MIRKLQRWTNVLFEKQKNDKLENCSTGLVSQKKYLKGSPNRTVHKHFSTELQGQRVILLHGFLGFRYQVF